MVEEVFLQANDRAHLHCRACNKVVKLSGRDGSDPVLAIAESQAVALLPVTFVWYRFYSCSRYRPDCQTIKSLPHSARLREYQMHSSYIFRKYCATTLCRDVPEAPVICLIQQAHQ